MSRRPHSPPLDPSAPSSLSKKSEDVEEADTLFKIKELQLALHELQEENDHLRGKLRTSEARLHALEKSQAKRAVYLPDEILRLILLRAVPSTAFLDTSHSLFYPSPYARALTTRKSIVLTCAQWARVGYELLYETVTLHRLGPLVALARTLASRPALGDFVRAIYIHLGVLQGHTQLYLHVLQAVLTACPRLEHITHNAQLPDLEGAGRVSHHVHYEVLGRSLGLLPRGLRKLEILSGLWMNLFVNIAGEFMVLEELSVALQSFDRNLENFPTEQLEFPRLTSLRVSVDRGSVRAFGTVAHNWRTPALTHLRLDLHTVSEHIDTFLLAPSRSRIRYLNLHSCCDTQSPETIQLEFLPHACPALAHIVLSAGATLSETPHPSVRHLDLWTPRGPQLSIDCLERIRAEAPRAFPGHCTLRMVDRALPGATDWPRLFPPTVDATEAVDYVFEGFCVRVTDDAITRVDAQLIGSENEGSDSDYTPNSDDDQEWDSDTESDGRGSDGDDDNDDDEDDDDDDDEEDDDDDENDEDLCLEEEVLAIWERAQALQDGSDEDTDGD
ncbi:hypothetical protein HWV62_10160 [Athelia sp. TMB]|nr:hypothetical protein HWV62_10160 [Athelia sp. TMB]